MAPWLPSALRAVTGYITYAACVTFKRSLVAAGLVEKIYRQEFGARGRMLHVEGLQHSPVKVAVVTCDALESTGSTGSIVTTYNRRSGGRDAKSIAWLQADDCLPDVEVWKA